MEEKSKEEVLFRCLAFLYLADGLSWAPCLSAKYVSKRGGTHSLLEASCIVSSSFNLSLRCRRMMSLLCLLITQISPFFSRKNISYVISKKNRLISLLLLSSLLHQRYYLILNWLFKLHIFSFFHLAPFIVLFISIAEGRFLNVSAISH